MRPFYGIAVGEIAMLTLRKSVGSLAVIIALAAIGNVFAQPRPPEPLQKIDTIRLDSKGAGF